MHNVAKQMTNAYHDADASKSQEVLDLHGYKRYKQYFWPGLASHHAPGAGERLLYDRVQVAKNGEIKQNLFWLDTGIGKLYNTVAAWTNPITHGMISATISPQAVTSSKIFITVT